MRLEPYFPEEGPRGQTGQRPRGQGASWQEHEEVRRRIQRGFRSVFVRMRRAGYTFVALFAALTVYAVGWGVGFFTFLLAMVAIVMVSLFVLTLPVRDRSRDRRDVLEGQARPVAPGATTVPLPRLAAQTEEWLVARCRALPSAAGPALDRIVARLRDFQPALDGVGSDTAIGGDARRLIGEHLPDLVTKYLGLPPGDRHFQADASARLAESLDIVAGQMDDLCERLAAERRLKFETERRFIETRYSDGSAFGADR